MNEYYQNKEDKTKDFIKGFFINVGIGAAAFVLYWIFYGIGLASSNISKGIAISIVIILLTIIEFLLIKKHLKERRYIAIGMIVAIVVPLLVVGACSPLFFSI